MMSIDPAQPLSELPLAFVDVETTGLSPRFGHRVIEVAVLRVEGGRVVDSYAQLISPGRPISGGITRLTGISNEMVEHAPGFAGVIDNLLARLHGAAVVGHNASFDAAFLRSEFAGCGRCLHDELAAPMVFDTLRLARRLSRGQRNGLAAVCARLGVTCDEPAHRAMGDCLRTLGVFRAMMVAHGGFDCPMREFLSLHGRPGTLRERATTNAAAPLPFSVGAR